jgi:hypothetical protein
MKEVNIMRKTLSIILSVMMILSVCSFAIPASAAPEGTAINTADEFLAMVSTPADSAEVTAKYYLNADITLSGTYIEPFWGILDGNGHTVTVSAPMFADFSGEVRNLKIKGEILFQDANAAAFTVLSAKGLNVINCQNDANVTITGNAKWAAGFVADCENNEVPCVFVNSVNNGDIYVDSTADEKMRAGGFGGIIDGAVFMNCVNNGDIYMKGNICIAGGLVSRVALHAATYTAEAYNCVNNGNIKVEDTYLAADGVSFGSGSADAGGIFGHVGCKNQAGWYRIYGCRNNGKIDAPYRVGGMVGYVYASGTNAFADVQFCVNTGDIVYGKTQRKDENTVLFDYGSPFVAYTNSSYTTIKFNVNTGSVSQHEGTVSERKENTFFGCSSADATMYDLQGNYDINYDQYKYYSYASPYDKEGAYVAQIHEISETDGIIKTTLEDIKSGKVCYEIMTLAEDDAYGYAEGFAFYQKIGSDDYPTSDETHGWVVLSNGAYVNGERGAEETEPVATEPQETEPATTEPEATEPETTEAPSQGEATEAPQQGGEQTTPTTEKKGCGGFVAGSAIIVAILGTALIIKKRD